jgi:hypothetical protein
VISDCLTLPATGCCASTAYITELNCTVTSGILGEVINNYPNHPALIV